MAGANLHNTMLLQRTPESVFLEPSCLLCELVQHLCLDRGYDDPPWLRRGGGVGYVPHIRRIGKEKRATIAGAKDLAAKLAIAC